MENNYNEFSNLTNSNNSDNLNDYNPYTRQEQSAPKQENTFGGSAPKKEKSKGFGATLAKCVALALVFGLVAGAAFTGVSYLGGNAFGIFTDADNSGNKPNNNQNNGKNNSGNQSAENKSYYSKQNNSNNKKVIYFISRNKRRPFTYSLS